MFLYWCEGHFESKAENKELPPVWVQIWNYQRFTVGREISGLHSNPLNKTGLVWGSVQLISSVAAVIPHISRTCVSTDLSSPSPAPRQQHERQFCFAQTNTCETSKLKSWSKVYGKLYRLRDFPHPTVGWGWDGNWVIIIVALNHQLSLIHGWTTFLAKHTVSALWDMFATCFWFSLEQSVI